MRYLKTIIVVGVLVLALATPVLAQESVDLDCDNFSNQQDAQAFLDAYPDDPDRLDSDGDGIACEELDSGGMPANQENSPATAQYQGGSPGAGQYQYASPSASAAPLPDTGGPPLVSIGAGAFLIAAGLIARRITH